MFTRKKRNGNEHRATSFEFRRWRFLVLGHSKFGRRATVRGGHITEVTAVFTDRPAPDAIAASLHEAGVRLVVWPHPNSAPTPDGH